MCNFVSVKRLGGTDLKHLKVINNIFRFLLFLFFRHHIFIIFRLHIFIIIRHHFLILFKHHFWIFFSFYSLYFFNSSFIFFFLLQFQVFKLGRLIIILNISFFLYNLRTSWFLNLCFIIKFYRY